MAKLSIREVARIIENEMDKPLRRLRVHRAMRAFPNQVVLSDRDGQQFILTVQKARIPRERKHR